MVRFCGGFCGDFENHMRVLATLFGNSMEKLQRFLLHILSAFGEVKINDDMPQATAASGPTSLTGLSTSWV